MDENLDVISPNKSILLRSSLGTVSFGPHELPQMRNGTYFLIFETSPKPPKHAFVCHKYDAEATRISEMLALEIARRVLLHGFGQQPHTPSFTSELLSARLASLTSDLNSLYRGPSLGQTPKSTIIARIFGQDLEVRYLERSKNPFILGGLSHRQLSAYGEYWRAVTFVQPKGSDRLNDGSGSRNVTVEIKACDIPGGDISIIPKVFPEIFNRPNTSEGSPLLLLSGPA